MGSVLKNLTTNVIEKKKSQKMLLFLANDDSQYFKFKHSLRNSESKKVISVS